MEYTECKFEVCSTAVSNPTRAAAAVFKCSGQKVGVTMGVVNLLTPIGNPLVVLYLIAAVQYSLTQKELTVVHIQISD